MDGAGTGKEADATSADQLMDAAAGAEVNMVAGPGQDADTGPADHHQPLQACWPETRMNPLHVMGTALPLTVSCSGSGQRHGRSGRSRKAAAVGRSRASGKPAGC
jgi:hypothetical protein